MKVYVGRIEPITEERWVELGWSPEDARARVREGATEPRVYVQVPPDHDGGTGFENLLEPTPAAAQRSPDGFSWGYGGSGPSALASSILAHYQAGLEESPVLVMDFKDNFLGSLDSEAGFEITEEAIRAWLIRHPRYRPTEAEALADPQGLVEGMTEEGV